MATSSELPGPGHLEILLNEPAVPPPAGIISNLDSPPNIDAICYTTFSLCVSLASLAVGIRLYTKRFLIHCIAYEDCEYPKFVFAVRTMLTWILRLVYDSTGTNSTQPNAYGFTPYTDRLAFGAYSYPPCSLKEVVLESIRGIYD